MSWTLKELTMNSRMLRILVGALLVMASYAVASAQESQVLVGSWNYESMTNLKDGKPFGTLHFKPGQWTITFNADGHWTRNAPLPAAKPQSGTYKVHKHELTLKHDVVAPDDRFDIRFQSDGKVLMLSNKDTIYQASRQL
jgi:hypothetical protein